MMTLYVKTGCGYWARALAAAEELGIELNIKNVADEGVREELASLGGKQQEPFLVDEECDVQMYESEAIIQYFEEKVGKKTNPSEKGPMVCPI